MGTIEDALRETFAAEVNELPVMDGVADRAIVQARRTRRTHVSVGAAAAMIALVLAGGTSIALHNRMTPLPATAANGDRTAPPTVPAITLDLLVGDQIHAADGRRIPLVETSTPQSAYRVGDNWLVLAQDLGATDHSLWLAQPDGTTRRLVTGIGVAVSPDGSQVAWATGDLLIVADLVDGRLINRRQTGGRRGLVPYAFAGEAVLLTAQDYVYEGTGTPPFDLWFPSRGAYVPGPTPKHAVYGMGLALGGARLLGMAAVGALGPNGREYCLAELDFGSLQPIRYACGLSISPVAGLSLSPDGHHAMVTSDDHLLLIDLDRVFDTPVVMGDWYKAYTGPVGWMDANTVVASDPSQLYVITVTDTQLRRSVALVGDGGELVQAQVIPRLR
jgi:hypothetical protein